MSERQKLIEKSKGRKFMDVCVASRQHGELPSVLDWPTLVLPLLPPSTETVSLGSFAKDLTLTKSYEYPTPNSTHAVKPILKLLSTTEPRTNLEKFTSFFTRYYRSKTGTESSEWLLAKIESYVAKAPKDVQKRVTVQAFPHTSWSQTSIIARFEPASKDARKEPVTIVGAHCDSTNMLPFLRSPGADDDGSGTVTTLEAFRAIVASGWQPATPVEFHWYSAEEGGLLGSQAIAQRYAEEGIKVKAMLRASSCCRLLYPLGRRRWLRPFLAAEMDMTAWVKAGTTESVGVITDFVDPALTKFNQQLIDKYRQSYRALVKRSLPRPLRWQAPLAFSSRHPLGRDQVRLRLLWCVLPSLPLALM
jgi:leucyl aminopeptidase